LRIRRGELNLYVRDLQRAVKFYSEALGFGLEESEASYCKLRQGDFTLTLFRAKSEGRGDPPGTYPGMTADMLVDDLDQAVSRIEQAGGSVGPIRAYEDGRFTLFRDPDGISWELIGPEGSGS